MADVFAQENTPTEDTSTENTSTENTRASAPARPIQADQSVTDAALFDPKPAQTPVDLPPFPQSRTPEPPRKKSLKPAGKIPVWLLATVPFLLGLVIGVLVMRHRA